MRKWITLFIAVVLLSGTLCSQPLDRISTYLDSKHIPQVAKDYYYGKFPAADDSRTHSILDSIATSSNITRPFYLLLVSRMMKNASGNLAQAIGDRCKNLAEQHPNQIISFLFSERGKKYLDSWGKVVATVLMKACEEPPIICNRFSFAVAMKKVNPANKRQLEQFYEKVALYSR